MATASGHGRRSRTPASRAALNVSPAPTVSTTSTAGAAARTARPASNQAAPSGSELDQGAAGEPRRRPAPTTRPGSPPGRPAPHVPPRGSAGTGRRAPGRREVSARAAWGPASVGQPVSSAVRTPRARAPRGARRGRVASAGAGSSRPTSSHVAGRRARRSRAARASGSLTARWPRCDTKVRSPSGWVRRDRHRRRCGEATRRRADDLRRPKPAPIASSPTSHTRLGRDAQAGERQRRVAQRAADPPVGAIDEHLGARPRATARRGRGSGRRWRCRRR